MNTLYISQIIVNNCYTYKNFSIPNSELKEFKHIILTGKNGSGKTTILNRLAFLLSQISEGRPRLEIIKRLTSKIATNKNHMSVTAWENELNNLKDIDIKFLNGLENLSESISSDFIFSFFKAHRKVNLKDVTTVTKEDEFF